MCEAPCVRDASLTMYCSTPARITDGRGRVTVRGRPTPSSASSSSASSIGPRSPAALSNEPVRLLPDMADMLAIAAVARRVAGEKASKSEAEPEL